MKATSCMSPLLSESGAAPHVRGAAFPPFRLFLGPLRHLPLRVVLEQPRLVVDALLARVGRRQELRREADRVARTRLLAVAAVDAPEHVDLERLRPPLAVAPLGGRRLGLDVDAQRRARAHAEETGDAL